MWLDVSFIDGADRLVLYAKKSDVAPARAEIVKAAHEKDVKEAFEKGVQDTMAKHKLPTDDKPSVPHPLFDQKEADKAGSPREAFEAGWKTAKV